MPEWTPALTPFGSLVAKQASSAVTGQREDRHSQLGIPGRKEFEEVSTSHFLKIYFLFFKHFM